MFLNGREIHVLEWLYLYRLFGFVPPGSYWLDAQGVGGPEGGPALFDLRAATQSAATQGAGGGGYLRRTQGGSIGSDGQTSYYFDAQSGCSVIPGEGVSC